MKKRWGALAVALALGLTAKSQINIIPQPQQVEPMTEAFALKAGVPIAVHHPALTKAARYLQTYLKTHLGNAAIIQKTEGKLPGITLQLNKQLASTPNTYRLAVANTGITITGNTDTAVFYGIQSLLQLLPAGTSQNKVIQIPGVIINDAPRFGYRGMMLDVARHFEPVDYIKKTIDRLAMLKMNTFHFHLTDDQGWRLEIKKYPLLTQVGAWRHGTIIGHYPGTGNDNKPHGGFYTQQQIKEIVQYAADRYITVIPEIEMPGHASAAIAAYPWLSCFPDEKTIIPQHPSKAAQAHPGKSVQESWGVYEDVFAPTERTFKFLEGVIDEVVALFPSKYIHVGGDECPKEAWKRSSFCQQLIKEKSLKDEHGLQSYFIQRMEKYINSKGRRIIGWDEILEGGLAPNATVMSWRGEAGGVEAANQHHEVIMTPTDYCYFDYSQSKFEDSLTIGGFIPLEKVYAYEPIPQPLRGRPEAAMVKGTQANLWTEYVTNGRKVEYMIFPRLAALAETAWTLPENKNWNHFESKLPSFFERLHSWGAHYSRAYYEVMAAIEPHANHNGVVWKISSKLPGAKLVYKTNAAADWLPYQQPVPITTSGAYKAAMMDDKGNILNTITQTFALHKAVGKPVTLSIAPASKYSGNGGVQGLVNGASSQKGLNSAEWVGWQGGNLDATIDLQQMQTINQVVVHAYESRGSWIYRPQEIIVETSADGKSFNETGRLNVDMNIPESQLRQLVVPIANVQAQYLRVKAINFGTIPAGMAGASHPAWLFVDEIEVL